MIENEIKLDPKGGQQFVQFGNNVAAAGEDLLYPMRLQQENDQKPTSPKQTFWLRELQPDEHISPVYGVKDDKQ